MLVDLANVQQMTGIACFALAAAACANAARHVRRAWTGLAWTQAAFCLEIVVNARHRLHDIVDAVLIEQGWYPGRTPWQIGLLVVVVVLAIVVAPIAWRRVRGDAMAAVALVASLLVATSLAVEAVSLHDVDGWMYAPGGTLLPVVLGWIAASLVVTAAALAASRR